MKHSAALDSSSPVASLTPVPVKRTVAHKRSSSRGGRDDVDVRLNFGDEALNANVHELGNRHDSAEDLELCKSKKGDGERYPASAPAMTRDGIGRNPYLQDVFGETYMRGRWLLGLLVLQSTSSFVLDQYQDLLKEHLVVTLFLTMLVGAGGNAGNQSAIKVIRGLATRQMDGSKASVTKVMQQQIAVGLLLGLALAAVGFVRVYVTDGHFENSCAISVSLFLIVLVSTILGTSLPFALFRFGVDPANAGTSIQVIMDILGVTITCWTCNSILSHFASTLASN